MQTQIVQKTFMNHVCSINISIQCQTILKMALASCNTVVVLVSHHQQHQIRHYSQKGQLMNATITSPYFFNFGMLRNDEIILHSLHGAVACFTLRTYTFKEFRKQSVLSSKDRSKKVFFFPETSMFCLVHQQQPGDHKINAGEVSIHLEYYFYRDMQHSCDFITSFKHKSTGYTYYIQKMDQHSKMAWIQVTVGGTLLHIYELDVNMEGQLRSVNVGIMGDLFNRGYERTWKPICELSKNVFVSAMIYENVGAKGKTDKIVKYSMFRVEDKNGLKCSKSGTDYMSTNSSGHKLYENVFKKKDFIVIATEQKNSQGNLRDNCILLKIRSETGQVQGTQVRRVTDKERVEYENVEWSDRTIIEKSSRLLDTLEDQKKVNIRVIDVLDKINYIEVLSEQEN